MKIALHLRSSGRAATIAELELPGFNQPPQVVICGSQVFTRLTETLVYHEVSSYALCEPLNKSDLLVTEIVSKAAA